MRRASLFHALLCTGPLLAQVKVDRSVIFTSSDSAQRQVDGLTAPLTEGDLITLSTARSGGVHLATVGGSATAMTLTTDPPASAYVTGMLLRFLPVNTSSGSVTVNVDGLGPRAVLRHDLLPVAWGDLLPGRMVEMQYMDTAFVILSRPGSDCPPGFLPVNAHYCIQQTDVDNQNWYAGQRFCADRGARLCTWDEYYHACMVQSANLSGLFDDWEWFDDTADHTHTAVQGGRWQCRSQRSIGAVDTEVHSTRCCYRIR